MIKKLFGLSIVFTIFAESTLAQTQMDTVASSVPVQNDSTVSVQNTKKGFWSRISPVPVLAYAPETKLQYGALLVYKLGDDPKDASRVEYALIGTQNTQFKAIVYADQYLNQRHFQNTLEYRYWPSHFYKSVETGRFRDPLGSYDLNSLEYEGSAEVNLLEGFWLGAGWNIKQSEISWPDSIASIDKPSLASIGGIISGPSLLLSYDRRDHVLEPSTGIYASWKGNFYTQTTLSDQSYQKHAVDLREFFSLASETVFGVALGTEFVFGDVPFYALPSTDGVKKFRGVDRGVILGRKVLSAQSELRFPLVPRRDWSIAPRLLNYLNGAVFVDGAWAGDFDGNIKENWLPTYGVGVRWALDAQQKTYIRLDLAVVDGGISPVVFIREAF